MGYINAILAVICETKISIVETEPCEFWIVQLIDLLIKYNLSSSGEDIIA